MQVPSVQQPAAPPVAGWFSFYNKDSKCLSAELSSEEAVVRDVAKSLQPKPGHTALVDEVDGMEMLSGGSNELQNLSPDTFLTNLSSAIQQTMLPCPSFFIKELELPPHFVELLRAAKHGGVGSNRSGAEVEATMRDEVDIITPHTMPIYCNIMHNVHAQQALHGFIQEDPNLTAIWNLQDFSVPHIFNPKTHFVLITALLLDWAHRLHTLLDAENLQKVGGKPGHQMQQDWLPSIFISHALHFFVDFLSRKNTLKWRKCDLLAAFVALSSVYLDNIQSTDAIFTCIMPPNHNPGPYQQALRLVHSLSSVTLREIPLEYLLLYRKNDDFTSTYISDVIQHVLRATLFGDSDQRQFQKGLEASLASQNNSFFEFALQLAHYITHWTKTVCDNIPCEFVALPPTEPALSVVLPTHEQVVQYHAQQQQHQQLPLSLRSGGYSSTSRHVAPDLDCLSQASNTKKRHLVEIVDDNGKQQKQQRKTLQLTNLMVDDTLDFCPHDSVELTTPTHQNGMVDHQNINHNDHNDPNHVTIPIPPSAAKSTSKKINNNNNNNATPSVTHHNTPGRCDQRMACGDGGEGGEEAAEEDIYSVRESAVKRQRHSFVSNPSQQQPQQYQLHSSGQYHQFLKLGNVEGTTHHNNHNNHNDPTSVGYPPSYTNTSMTPSSSSTITNTNPTTLNEQPASLLLSNNINNNNDNANININFTPHPPAKQNSSSHPYSSLGAAFSASTAMTTASVCSQYNFADLTNNTAAQGALGMQRAQQVFNHFFPTAISRKAHCQGLKLLFLQYPLEVLIKLIAQKFVAEFPPWLYELQMHILAKLFCIDDYQSQNNHHYTSIGLGPTTTTTTQHHYAHFDGHHLLSPSCSSPQLFMRPQVNQHRGMTSRRFFDPHGDIPASAQQHHYNQKPKYKTSSSQNDFSHQHGDAYFHQDDNGEDDVEDHVDLGTVYSDFNSFCDDNNDDNNLNDDIDCDEFLSAEFYAGGGNDDIDGSDDYNLYDGLALPNDLNDIEEVKDDALHNTRAAPTKKKSDALEAIKGLFEDIAKLIRSKRVTHDHNCAPMTSPQSASDVGASIYTHLVFGPEGEVQNGNITTTMAPPPRISKSWRRVHNLKNAHHHHYIRTQQQQQQQQQQRGGAYPVINIHHHNDIHSGDGTTGHHPALFRFQAEQGQNHHNHQQSQQSQQFGIVQPSALSSSSAATSITLQWHGDTPAALGPPILSALQAAVAPFNKMAATPTVIVHGDSHGDCIGHDDKTACLFPPQP